MNKILSVETGRGDEYRIKLSTFEGLPDEIIARGIEIVDIALERVSGNQPTNPNILYQISELIAEELEGNEDIILYFYCDDTHELPKCRREITVQEYRSRLFSNMFTRYVSLNGISDFENSPIRIKREKEGDVFIHLIARECHREHVMFIKDFIEQSFPPK